MIIYGSALGVNIETDRRSLEWISGGTNFLIVILRLNCFSTFNPEDDPPPDTIHIGRLNTAKYTSVETYQITDAGRGLMSVNMNKTLSLMPGILAFGKFQGDYFRFIKRLGID